MLALTNTHELTAGQPRQQAVSKYAVARPDVMAPVTHFCHSRVPLTITAAAAPGRHTPNVMQKPCLFGLSIIALLRAPE